MRLQRYHHTLVDRIAGNDFRIGKPGFVEHRTRCAAQICKVTAVEPHAKRHVAQLAKDLEHAYRVRHTALERIIRVHQQQRAIGECCAYARKAASSPSLVASPSSARARSSKALMSRSSPAAS